MSYAGRSPRQRKPWGFPSAAARSTLHQRPETVLAFFEPFALLLTE